MASRSLGTLTLDLIAKVGGFVAGMEKAERTAKKGAKEIGSAADAASLAWGKLGKVAAGALSGITVGAVFGAVIRNTKQMEKEQAQLEAVLRSTGESAGFSREQLNEMASSMERTSTVSAGEINQAQTNLLAFTGIVGEQFPRALQSAIDMAARTGTTVTSAAETIGRALDVPSKGLTALSKQGFRFTEEQKKAAEQLEATGRTAEAQGIILKALEESYGGAAAASRDTFGGALMALQNTIDGLLTGSEGSLDGAKGAIDDLNRALSDPATAESVSKLVDLLAQGASTVVDSLPFLIDAGDGVVRVFSIAADALVGVFATATMHAQGLAASMFETLSLLPDALGGDDFAARAAEYRASAAINLGVAKEAADGIRDALERPLAGSAIADAASKTKELNKAKKESRDLDDAAISAAAKAAGARKEAEAAAKRQQQAVASLISSMQLEAATVGMTANEQKLYRLQLDGATASQLAQAKAAIETVESFKQQQKAQEDYRKLVQDLRTDEERLLDTTKERLAVLDAMQGLSDEERNRVASRIVSDSFSAPPSFGGADAVVAGPQGELDKIDKAEEELEKWYQTQLDLLNASREAKAELTAQWDEQELKLKQEHEDALAAIERSRQQVTMSANEQFFGNLSGLARTFFGEQSGLYKAAFVAEKSYAIAKTLLNAPKTASDAYSAMAGIPVIGPALGIAAAAAAVTTQLAQVAAVKNVNLSGMAHDGIDAVPETGTWLLQKGERVTTAETSAKLDRTLDDVRANQSSGGAPTINLIEDRSRAGQVNTRRQDDQYIIDVVVADLFGDGRTSKAIGSSFGMRRSGT
ncbi:TPA: phage tail length tape measure family protein [Pseudomonas aeruginosa]|uniref:phage tail length tape measure family protein n=1 Tax=Pseudomonas aeruginosa TaxID=287 RepID=UPI00071B462D|nr:phage tail length tape measure family protein [Pseudomonas aeruginosa]KSJ79670.1 phage tail tape measure protein [Pseudomonas aeruginosa]MBA1313551.1 phage tail tape measure protein [Pseudomonas aeruginosa]MBG7600686.1 phage tail length tape measure family protein [Pseudomonas aeruginosa]MBH3557822.1 phage tail length tape measure family protein [Pseudomonas aeruginosa]MBH4458083.1 phage tail length tape measure family protein [Pseudomonas aeruginosa]